MLITLMKVCYERVLGNRTLTVERQERGEEKEIMNIKPHPWMILKLREIWTVYHIDVKWGKGSIQQVREFLVK